MTASPNPSTDGWTNQAPTSTPVENGKVVTKLNTSVVDETTAPTAGHNRNAQKLSG